VAADCLAAGAAMTALDFDPYAWLAKHAERRGAAAKAANPAKETQQMPCGTLAGLAGLATGTLQNEVSTALPEPRADASSAAWGRYFDDQLRVIAEDLAAEGTSWRKVSAEMRPKRHKKSDEARCTEAFGCRYFADFRPGPDTPQTPCSCGDTVSWRSWLLHDWRCRSCQRPRSNQGVRWFVLPRTAHG
jgi:hypothetical protein